MRMMSPTGSRKSRNRFVLGLALLGGILVWGAVSVTYGQAEKKPREQKGLKFDVPDDWPIEERGGVVAPIPVEEYVSQKFQEYDPRLEALQRELNSNFEELQKQLGSLEENLKEEIKKAREQIEPLRADITDLELAYDRLKAEQGRLARGKDPSEELKSQISLLTERLERLDRQITSLEFQIDLLREEVGSQ